MMKHKYITENDIIHESETEIFYLFNKNTEHYSSKFRYYRDRYVNDMRTMYKNGVFDTLLRNSMFRIHVYSVELSDPYNETRYPVLVVIDKNNDVVIKFETNFINISKYDFA